MSVIDRPEAEEKIELSQFSPELYPELQPERLWVPVRTPVALLKRGLEEVKEGGLVRIWSGELNSDIYGRDDVIEAIVRVVRDKRASFRFLVGPVVATDAEGRNRILQLARDHPIEVRFRGTRTSIEHFRVIETQAGLSYYSELPHPPLQPLNERQRLDTDNVPAEWLAVRAGKATALFDRWWDAVARIAESEPVPLRTTTDGLRTLVSRAQETGRDFDDLGPDELMGLPGAEELLRTAG